MQIAAMTVTGIAVFLRLGTWERSLSRPMTTALALAGAHTLLRFDPVNKWANNVVSDIDGFNNLPQLLANILWVAAAAALAKHIANASGREDAMPTIRCICKISAIGLVLTYWFSESQYLSELPLVYGHDLMAIHWLIAAAVTVAVNAAMISCTYRARSLPGRERIVLMAYEFGAYMGIVSGLKRALEVLSPIDLDISGSWHLSYLAIIGYASASIFNAYLKRTEPHPERERIDGVGGTTSFR